MKISLSVTLLMAVLVRADVLLYQSDFTSGTYRITEPGGRYVLSEDVTFNPNANGATAYDSCWVEPEQFQSANGSYPDAEYALGFFAAITVETDGVEIDLNGYTIEQGEEHALLQRFFTVIELANSPFLPHQGPHTFTSAFTAATNAYIHNGVIGRSSHHGIHGNANVNIRIEDIEFNGYEVGGVALNGVDGFNLENCYLTNRKDIPVMGTFSAARFLQRYIDYLVAQGSATTLRVQGIDKSVTEIRDALKASINNVYSDVMQTGSINGALHPVEHALFANVAGVIDGNSYSVLLNKIGVAVNGFPHRPTAPYTENPSSDVRLKNVHVHDQRSNIHEIVGIKQGGGIVSDSVGAILQLVNTDHQTNTPITISDLDHAVAEYTGNPVADVQIIVGKAIANGEFDGSGISTQRNGINAAIVHWVEEGASGSADAKLATLAADEGWQCNGDSMAHVQKGAIAFKIDGSTGVRIDDCTATAVENIGMYGSDLCGDYEFSHPGATLPHYNGAHVRGFSFAGSNRVTVKRSSVSNLDSIHGSVCGFDIFTDSTDIDMQDCSAFDLRSEEGNATAFHLGGSTSFSDLKRWCAALITAPNGESNQVWDEEGVRNVVRSERCR